MSDCSGNAWKTAKPVVRSDGRRYPSITRAAQEIVDADGCGSVATVAKGISHVCTGRPHCLTAYGYGWRFLGAGE